MAIFTRQEIEEGLRRLGELAQAKGLQVELTLVGGAVMVLRFDARPSTRDVDAVILSPREARIVRDLARQVAEEHDWPEDWLNDGAKGYLVGISKGPLVFQAPGIEVHAPSMEQLLAMKLSACVMMWIYRTRDVCCKKLRKVINAMKSGKTLNLIS